MTEATRDFVWGVGIIWIIVGFVFSIRFAMVIEEKEKKSGQRIYDVEDNKKFMTCSLFQMSCFILGPTSFFLIKALKRRLEKIPDLPVNVLEGKFSCRGNCCEFGRGRI